MNKPDCSQPSGWRRGARFILLVMLSSLVAVGTAAAEEAGKDAGTLLLRSVPNKARVWVDGKPVGNTPLLLILPPGGYKVEMRGERLEFAQRQGNLLPKEKREVVFPLKLRYPTQVLLQQSSSIRARE